MLTMKEYNDEARRKGKFLIGHGNTALSTTSPRWEDDPDGHGGTLHVYAARSVLIPDNALWAKWKSDCSSFPMHILKFIATNKGPASDLLRLISPEVRYLPGENLITEKIDQTGAFILITPEGQSDLALSVEGRMVIGFPEDDDYILESVSLDKSTQYVKDFAVNHLKNELYPCTPPGMGRTIGEIVQYMPALKEGKLFSNKVAKKFGSSNAVIWRAEIAQGEPIIINIGSGFRTADGLGVVLEMGQNGVILKWLELWDQAYFDSKYPCVIRNMSQYDLFETNKERLDQVCVESILQVFPILPAALIQPKDQFGKGARFLVGVVNVESDSPLAMYGLSVVKGEELLQCLHDQASLTPYMDLTSYTELLRAAIEDAIRDIAEHKIESARKPASFIEINLVPGEICMAILHALTLKTHREVTYKHNQLAVEFKAVGWKALEPIMLRDATKTVVPDSGVVIVGIPKFKWMLMPYSKLVLSLESYTLLSPGESASHVDVPKCHEYNVRLSDRQYCSFCIRKYCICKESAQD